MAGADIIYIITWDNHTRDSYRYGTQLTFRDDGCVLFRNRLMPSGTVIRSWSSHKNYQADRIEPQLPILIGGERYRIRTFLRSTPENTALLRLTFYDRQQTNLGRQMVEKPEEEFIAPEGIDYWTLELCSSGMEEVLFHHIEVERCREPAAEEGTGQKPQDEWNILILRRQSRTVHVPADEICRKIPGLTTLTLDEAEWRLSAGEGLVREKGNPLRINFIGYDKATDDLANRAAVAMYGTGLYPLCHVVEADHLVKEPDDVNASAAVFADREWILKRLPQILRSEL